MQIAVIIIIFTAKQNEENIKIAFYFRELRVSR